MLHHRMAARSPNRSVVWSIARSRTVRAQRRGRPKAVVWRSPVADL